jgi:hypothetical protein
MGDPCGRRVPSPAMRCRKLLDAALTFVGALRRRNSG